MSEEDPLPPGLARKVNPHLTKTMGIVVATREPCLGIIRDEAASGRVRGRRFVALPLPALVRWKPPSSWVLGVLLCPGDDARPVLEWVRAQGIQELERIRFYLHKGTAEASAMAPWTLAGFSYRARIVDSWESLHVRFGRQHAFWALRDHAPDTSWVS